VPLTAEARRPRTCRAGTPLRRAIRLELEDAFTGEVHDPQFGDAGTRVGAQFAAAIVAPARVGDFDDEQDVARFWNRFTIAPGTQGQELDVGFGFRVRVERERVLHVDNSPAGKPQYELLVQLAHRVGVVGTNRRHRDQLAV
jgi:hypothetical protein